MAKMMQHPSDAELASALHISASQLAHLPKSDIGNAVAKVLQGYDWSLVPLANRWWPPTPKW